MPGSPQKLNQRQRQRETTRRKVMDAGIELFSLKGFLGTSIAEVADLAGVKKTLVMHHFGSKDQLWRDCVDDIFRRVDRFIREEFGREPPVTLEDFRRHQQIWIEACFRFPGYIRIPSVEGTVDNERVRWLAEKHILRSHMVHDEAFRLATESAGIPYDRMKLNAIRTGWVQLLVTNKPLYEHVGQKRFITESEMLKWSDELFDLIFGLKP